MKKPRTELLIASCLLSAGFAPGALAQAVSGQSAELSEILVTGTRRSGMAVSDSPAPVQMVSAEMLAETGAPDLMNAIATQVPSYNANQTGTDMASQTLTASMRALSPNHALVLVNGKGAISHPMSGPAAALQQPICHLFHHPRSVTWRCSVMVLPRFMARMLLQV